MTEKDAKCIRIPIWLATVLLSAMLAVCADVWRKVNTIETDLRCLKTALKAAGVLDPSLCVQQNCRVLAEFSAAGFSQVIQDVPETRQKKF